MHMNRLRSAVVHLAHAVRHHMVVSGIAIMGVLGCIGGGIALAAHHTDTPVPAATTHAAARQQGSVQAAETATSNTSQDPSASTPSNAITPKTVSPRAAIPASQKRLIISPASFTVKAGASYNGITMKSDDGKGVNMPMVGSGPQGIFTNFPAGPAKASWGGNIMAMNTVQPGTYTVTFKAQTDRTDWYSGTVTITILPTGTASVAVQQTGYDAASDAMIFSVKLNRQNGYTLAVDRWFAIDIGNTLECPFSEIGPDTYEVLCYHAQGARPATGRLDVNIFMANNGPVFSGSTSFTLPPKQ